MPVVSRLPVALALVALVASVVCGLPALREVGRFTAKGAAFAHVPKNGAGPLIVSAFSGDPFISSAVLSDANFAATFANGNVNLTQLNHLNHSFQWPNSIHAAPAGVCGAAAGWLMGDGFLVPFHNDGNVYCLDATLTTATAMAPAKSGWFYHKAIAFDVDGDGDLDILTARATKPILGTSQGELLWLENTGVGTAGAPWPEHAITTGGPDVFFDVAEGSTPANLVLVAAQFFSTPGFSATVVSNGQLAAGPRIVDSTIGPGDGVELAALDGDSSADIAVVTNHVNNASLSGVFAYVPPAVGSSPAANWAAVARGVTNATRVTLAQGMFKTISWLPHSAAPGIAYPFKPIVDASGPMWVAVAGDGAEGAFLLRPSEGCCVRCAAATGDAALASYNTTRFIAPDGTVAALGVADIDGDGFTDVLAPNNDKNWVTAYTFSP